MSTGDVAYWDEQAARFDAQPDHGLGDVLVRDAWRRLLASLMPPPGAFVADLGCGTGSLAVLCARLGHTVVGLDSSPAMLDLARAKAEAAGVDIRFVEADAAAPQLEAGSFDVVLVRHLLWAMADRDAAVASWCGLLAPRGRLLLIEGRWDTGGGIERSECEALVARHRRNVASTPLTDPALWGRWITDDRYVVVSTG